MTSPPGSPSDRIFVRLTWLIVAAGAVARLVRFSQPYPLWGDEIFVCQNFHDRDFRTILNQLDNGQICPPLFLWAQLAVFKLFGGGEQAMRVLPLLASLAGMLGFAGLARKLLPAFPAFLAVGFLSVAIWPVNLSTFAKPYSFDLAAAVAVIAAGVYWRARPESLSRGLILAAVVVVAMLASYTTAFVAGGVLLALLPAIPDGGPRGFVSVGLAGSGLLAAFAFVLQVGKAQLDTPDVPIKNFLYDYWRHGFPPDNPWRTPLWLLQALTGRMFAYPVGDGNGGSTLTFLMASLGGWVWWRQYPRWLFVLLVTPVLLNLVAAYLWKYPFGACGRLSQYAAPTICLFAGLGASTFIGWLFPSARATRIASWVYAVVFLGLATGYVISAILEPFHDPEAKWVRDTVAEFENQLRPGDRVVMRPPVTVDVPIPRWHFRLLGDRVTWGGRWPTSTDVKRVWVVDLWQGPHAEPHTPPPLTVPPGWGLGEVSRRVYDWPATEKDQRLTLVYERYDRAR